MPLLSPLRLAWVLRAGKVVSAAVAVLAVVAAETGIDLSALVLLQSAMLIQTAPAYLLGMYWRGARAIGIVVGLMAGHSIVMMHWWGFWGLHVGLGSVIINAVVSVLVSYCRNRTDPAGSGTRMRVGAGAATEMGLRSDSAPNLKPNPAITSSNDVAATAAAREAANSLSRPQEVLGPEAPAWLAGARDDLPWECIGLDISAVTGFREPISRPALVLSPLGVLMLSIPFYRSSGVVDPLVLGVPLWVALAVVVPLLSAAMLIALLYTQWVQVPVGSTGTGDQDACPCNASYGQRLELQDPGLCPKDNPVEDQFGDAVRFIGHASSQAVGVNYG